MSDGHEPLRLDYAKPTTNFRALEAALHRQRLIMTLLVAFALIPVAGLTQEPWEIVTGPLIFCTVLAYLVFACRLALAVNDGLGGVLVCLGLLVPIANLLVVIFLFVQADAYLRQKGVRTSKFGLKLDNPEGV